MLARKRQINRALPSGSECRPYPQAPAATRRISADRPVLAPTGMCPSTQQLGSPCWPLLLPVLMLQIHWSRTAIASTASGRCWFSSCCPIVMPAALFARARQVCWHCTLITRPWS